MQKDCGTKVGINAKNKYACSKCKAKGNTNNAKCIVY